MRTKLLLPLALLCFFITSCNLFNNYGKKVEINDKSEVYYKGEGVTESDAKKLGDYLLKIGYFDNTTAKTVQLLKDDKENGAYLVKFVVDKDALNKNRENALMTFWYWQDMLSTGVFDDKKTRVVLADSKLKDMETLDELTRITVGKEHYVYLKGNDVKQEEGKRIADSLEAAKFFDYTAGAVLLTKNKNAYLLRFMANDTRQANTSTDYNIVLENYRYIISKYILDGNAVDLVMIDGEFNNIKNIKEPTEDRKALIDQLIGRQQPAEPYSQTQYTDPSQELPSDDDSTQSDNN